jgi:hypothetical protein
VSGHGEKLSRKQEQAVAALLAEPTLEAAAASAGVGSATLRRWLREPEFAATYRQVRRHVVEGAVGRLQQAATEAADALKRNLTCGKPAAEIAAAKALLETAFRGLTDADTLYSERASPDASPMDTGDVVKVLAARLREVDAAELPTAEKSRLTATLADALLRAVGVDVLDKRLEALQAVLVGRKDAKDR